jgi:1-deoxy-D-xylulose-5-phosphate reductoisomerase
MPYREVLTSLVSTGRGGVFSALGAVRPIGGPGRRITRAGVGDLCEDGRVSVRDVVLLGSTGSIGTQAVDVVRRNRDRLRVVGIGAGGGNLEVLAGQATELGVDVVAVADPERAADLAELLPGRKVLAGPDAMTELAAWPCDVVLNGMTGSVGLAPTMSALQAGRTLALANKESLIAGGPLVTPYLSQVVPVDSEHSALAQCLRGGTAAEVARLVVTASGGPFRGRTRAELGGVTPQQALAHPTWAMGPVITINSSTLVNKGLEVIEAHLLFGIPYDRIDVVVHPQSAIHSMVEFVDGSTLAQVSRTDMRLPIALGLTWPDRVADAIPGMDWTRATSWTFEPLDGEAFPAVQLAREVGARGGTAPATFNAANEVCVEAFLTGRIPWLAIVDTVAEVVGAHPFRELSVVAEVLEAEDWARTRARELVERAHV